MLPGEFNAKLLDTLFEPSVPLHTLALPLLRSQTFATYNDLIAAIGVSLTSLAESASTSDTKWLEEILGSHPRLGAKKVESELSQGEQAQLQGSVEEGQKLAKLNAEYEAAFPGLRYVVFVDGRGRNVIMEDMRTRIAGGDLEAERRGAIRVSFSSVGLGCRAGMACAFERGMLMLSVRTGYV